MDVDRLPAAVAEVRRVPQQLEEGQERDRRERGAAGHRGREAQERRPRRRARLPQAQREERGGGQEDVEARLGVPGEELQRHDGGQAAGGQQPRPADEALREQEQPRQQRPDPGVVVGQPRHHPQVQREDEAGHQRPAEAQAERAAEQVRAEGRDPELEHGDPPERRPERQDVGGQVEGAEDGRLAVGLQRPPRRDRRVPQRRVRERGRRAVQEGLDVARRVAELRVARADEAGRLHADPGRLEPQGVGVRQRAPGQQPRAEEDQDDDGVEERRGGRRPPAQGVDRAARGRAQRARSRRRARRPTASSAASATSPSRLRTHPTRKLDGA